MLNEDALWSVKTTPFTIIKFLCLFSLNVSSSFAAEPITPLPQKHGEDSQKAALGQRLFHDPQLSRDGTISCASCHQVDSGGDDGQRFSIGHEGQVGDINAPTVLNARFNFVQFWNGRADSLEDQVPGPIHNPVEMASDWDLVIERLSSDPQYRAAFSNLYTDAITEGNIIDAIATYERTLITPNSPFDRWLTGDTNALGKDQTAGYRLFKRLGCVSCHQGINVGGNMFQKLGVMSNEEVLSLEGADLGRFLVTGNPQDKGVFKVPSLRNVEHTAPYFHDGRADTLEDAVGKMANYQLGISLPEDQISKLVAFLKSLSGDLPQPDAADE